ncbi:MAG: hypothetical protein ACLQVM_10340 [Terriglobia bacterium]
MTTKGWRRGPPWPQTLISSHMEVKQGESTLKEGQGCVPGRVVV